MSYNLEGQQSRLSNLFKFCNFLPFLRRFRNLLRRSPSAAEEVNNVCFENIFLHLDMKTLRNCMMTCRRFKNLLSNDSFWVERARIMGRVNTLPPLEWKKAANQKTFQGNENGEIDVSNFAFNFPKIVHKGGFSTIRPEFFGSAPNDFDEEIGSNESAIQATGLGIQMEENSGNGCQPHPDVEKCFAFSCNNSSLFLIVDLVARGIDPWILDYVRPKIRISQKINHRHDCEASLDFSAQLNLNSTHWEEGNEQSQESNFKIFKSINKHWSQTTQAMWTDVSIEFDDYPSGMRSLIVVNTGEGAHNGEGFYGPKVANIEIQLILPEIPMVRPLQEDTEREPYDEESEACVIA